MVSNQAFIEQKQIWATWLNLYYDTVLTANGSVNQYDDIRTRGNPSAYFNTHTRVAVCNTADERASWESGPHALVFVAPSGSYRDYSTDK